MAGADADSIAGLLSEYGDAMRRRARSVLRSDTDAEDIVQEVLLALLRAPHLLAAVDRIGGFLLAFVRRRAIDLVRARARRREQGLETLFLEARDPAELMARDEVARIVARAVAQLPGGQRQAFLGHALEGLTFRELSRRTGVPMGTLMARKKKAVDSIRARLRRQGLLPGRGGDSE